MTLAATDLDAPALAGADLVARPGLLDKLRKRFGPRRRQAFAHIPAEAYARPLHRQRTLFGPAIWLNDPAAIKRVLVDNAANYPKTEMERRFFTAVFGEGLIGSGGETWRTHRRIMAPSFDPRSVAAYAPAMAATSETFLKRWDALAPGAVIDVAAEMTSLTLQIIARTMFSVASDDLAPLADEAVRGAQAELNFSVLDLLPITGPARAARRERTMRTIFKGLDAALEALIAERERNLDGAPDDLLTRLIAARDSDGGARMSASAVRDQVVTIFLAGHETTAAAMAWIWYLVSQHPAAEAKLQAELDQVLAGRTPTGEDVARLPYTRMVIEESMRLYPPAPGVSNRKALAADEVGGEAVRAGTEMLISSWVLHRNPKYWPQPERFDPERFSPERSAARPRFAYLPFGAGPRVCIGMTLAMTEAILILATLAQRYRLTLAPGQTIEVQQYITIRPRGGLQMVLHPRG